MSDRLVTALRALSEETAVPVRDEVTSGHLAWVSAATARRRRRLGTLAGLAVVAVLVVVSLVSVATVPAAGPVPPAGTLGPGQGIPSTIYRVHPWLPTLGSRPIPPVVYIARIEGIDRGVAISVDGSYWLLPEPPESDADYQLRSFAVSPDGRRVAISWGQPTGPLPEGVTNRPGVAVGYDVTTGERLGPWYTAAVRGWMAELSWSPDNQHLAWSESRPTTVSTDTSAVTDVGVILDVRNGQTRELPEAHGGLAWSPDTTKVAAWTAGGIGLIPIDGGATTTLPASGYSDGPLLWSSNGDAIAAVSPCEVPAELDAGYVSCSQGEVGVTRDRLLIFVMSSGSDYRFELRDYPSDAAMLAWREPDGDPVIAGGAPGVARGPDAWTAPFEVNDRPSPGTGLQVITGSTPGPRYVEGVVGAQQLLTSAAVVELAPPAQSLLSTTFLGWVWSQYWHWTMPVVAVLLAVLLGWAWRRRRVRSQWVFDPT